MQWEYKLLIEITTLGNELQYVLEIRLIEIRLRPLEKQLQYKLHLAIGLMIQGIEGQRSRINNKWEGAGEKNNNEMK